MKWSIPQKPEQPKFSNKVVTHALFIQRLAQIQKNTMKELTSDFGLFYSEFVVYLEVKIVSNLKSSDFWIKHKHLSIVSICRSLNLMTPGVIYFLV